MGFGAGVYLEMELKPEGDVWVREKTPLGVSEQKSTMLLRIRSCGIGAFLSCDWLLRRAKLAEHTGRGVGEGWRRLR